MPELESGAAPAAPEPAIIAEATPAPVTIVETPKPSIEDTMAQVYEKNYPDSRVKRAESGKFESKTPVDGAEPAATTEQVEGAAPIETVAEPAPPAIDPPQSLPAELKAKWATLPREWQEIHAKRESEASRKISEQGETLKQYQPMQQVIERFAPTLRRSGLPPADAFARMLAVNEMLEQNAPAAIGEIARSYGVDLSQFARPAEGEQPPESAAFNALHQKIAQLERQLGETQNITLARERREIETQRTSLDTLVNDFAKDKDDHWSDIESEVIAQITAIYATNPTKDAKTVLQEAYTRAVKLNEDVSRKLSEAKNKAEAEKKAAEERRKAEEAKKLASLNVKSTSGKSPGPSTKSLEQDMAEIYDKIASRS